MLKVRFLPVTTGVDLGESAAGDVLPSRGPADCAGDACLFSATGVLFAKDCNALSYSFLLAKLANTAKASDAFGTHALFEE